MHFERGHVLDYVTALALLAIVCFEMPGDLVPVLKAEQQRQETREDQLVQDPDKDLNMVFFWTADAMG